MLPEDDAIRQIANGFLLDPSVRTNKVQVLREAGGWRRAQSDITTVYGATMITYPHRHLVVLIDCDGQTDRLQQIRRPIPSEYAGRVFIPGIASGAEGLKRALRSSVEAIR